MTIAAEELSKAFAPSFVSNGPRETEKRGETMFISKFPEISDGVWEIFSSKLKLIECKTDREIEGEQLEHGV